MKKISIIILLMLAFFNSLSIAQQNFDYETLPVVDNKKIETPRAIPSHTLQEVIDVPAGETFKAIFSTPVSSENAYTGQQVVLVIGRNYYYKDKEIFPAGSAITGTVIEVAKAKHGSINGKLSIRFTQVITPDGMNIPISAVIKTDDNSGVLIGGNEIKEIAFSETGKPKKGLTLNSLTGNGGSLIKSVWDKGSDVVIPINALVELLLLQPITIDQQKK